MRCPHCDENGISSWAKFKAGTAVPARCTYCKNPSAVSGVLLGAKGGALNFLLFGALVISWAYHSLVSIFTALLIYILLEAFIVKWVPLEPISEGEASRSRNVLYFFALTFLVLAVVAGVWYGPPH